MKGYEKSLVLVVVIAVALVDAFKNGRSIGSGSTVFETSNFPSYQGPRQHPPYHEQHRPFREQSFGQSVRTFRQPTSYRERSVLGDYSSFKNRPIHYRETSSYQNSPSSYGATSSTYGTRASFGNEHAFQDEYFKNRSPFQSSQRYFPNELRHSTSWLTSYREDPYKSVEAYKELEKETRERLPFDEHTNYLKYGNHGLGFASIPAAFDENTLPLDTETSTTLSTTLTATHKPLVEGTVSTTTQTIPEVHSSSTTDSKIAPKSATTITTTSGPNVETNTLGNAVSSSTSTILLPTMPPTVSVTPKQYSDVTRFLMTVTTSSNSSSSVTESPGVSFDGNFILSSDKHSSSINPSSSFVPSDFKNGFFNTIWKPSSEPTSSLKNSNQDNTFNLPASWQSGSSHQILNLSAIQHAGFQNALLNLQNNWKNTLQNGLLNTQTSPKSAIPSSLLNYLVSREPKNNDAIFGNYVLPSEPKLTFKDNIQGKFMEYLIPEESKQLLNNVKNNAQNTYLDYVLRQEPKQDISFRSLQSQALQPQALQSQAFNYVPLMMSREQKLTLPISTLSSMSRPIENMNYVPTVMPYFNADSSSSSRFTLGSSLPESLSSGLQGSLSASIPNSIPGSIPGGITAGMPASISTGIPTRIPTMMDFQQTFQQPDQIRSLQTTVSPYSGLQLQLGGFSGIDYGLRSNGPEVRPMELGIAKVGLNLPEFPRPNIPTFSKIGFGQQLW
ncbi:hypothetical protein KPH14_010276 [Odynerus spinipes]|uniref:Uncharacterized protein n=1 Tax=Odynerus spinipes TaxID=1348599 RepID=A0AAD9RTY9_9HYME|nr:hypothetical protein KPH14_010276 [Odynerus spinipes]